MNLNICRNSVFIPEEHKGIINAGVNRYFSSLIQEFEQRDLRVNVYYTGSLARGEPSISYTGDQIRLESDIDLVILTEGSFRENAWLMNITNWLNAKYTQYKSSAVLINTQRQVTIRSLIGQDLSKVITNPVYQTFDHVGIRFEPVTPDMRFEMIAHVASVFFLHPLLTGEAGTSILYKNIRHAYNKLVLECLRVLLPFGQTEGFYQVYNGRHSNRLQNIIEPDQIEGFVKAREMFGMCDSPAINVLELIEKTVRSALNLDDEDNLYEALKARAALSNRLIHSYQCAIIAFVLSLGQEECHRIKWLELLSCIVSRINRTDIRLSEQQLTKIASRDWECSDFSVGGITVYPGIAAMFVKARDQEIVQVMREMRESYLRKLYYHNTGERDIPDLYPMEASSGI